MGTAMAMTAGVALAVHDNGLFELDGNAVAEATAGDDWSPDPPGALEFVFATDPVEDPLDDIFAGNNKDTLDIADFQWKYGEPNDKNDIEHGYIAAYEHEGDQVFYFGMDFLANNGDKAIGVWVLQDDVAQVEDSSPPNFPFTGGHIDGDILLQADFTNGGVIDRIDVYTWGPNDHDNEQVANNSDLYEAFSSQDCDTVGADDLACANVNTQSVPAPWEYQYKCVGSSQPQEAAPPLGCQGVSGVQNLDIFPVATFFEGGVNVTELLGHAICAGSVMFETRQSQSETAALEDKLIADFDLCSIAVDKDGPELSKVGDDADYTITITNDGAVTLYKESIVDSVFGDLTDGTNAVITGSTCGDSLAPDASCTIDITYTVQEGDPDPLENTVTVVYDIASTLDGDEVTDSDDHSVDLFQPDISVDKTGDSLSKVGDDVSYTVTITNDSSSDSPDLVFDLIDDSLVGDLTDSNNYDSSTCGASIAWDESCVITYTYTVQEGDPDPLINTVTVESHPDGFPNDIDDSDDHSVDLFQPSVAIDKTGDELSKVGDDVNYTITVTNTSSSDSPNLTCDITDALLGIDEMDVSIAPGANHVINDSRTVEAGDPDPLVNTASVTCTVDGFTNVLGPLTDDHSTNLFQPDIEVVKTGPASATVGDTVTYDFTINNLSSSDSPNLILDSVTDTVLGDLTTTATAAGCDTLGDGGTCNFTFDYTILGTDPNPLVNVVTVHYHPDGFPNDITDDDDHSLEIIPAGEGCTPGWWKNQGVGAYDEATDALAMAVESAVESYWGAGWIYLGTAEGDAFEGTTDDLFRVAFNLTEQQMEARGLSADLTLLEAIELGGGGFKALARHGTAALLNSLSVNYEFSADEVLQDVHDAFVSGNLGTLIDDFNEANNQDHSSCPTGDTATGSAGDLILLAVVPATIRRLLKEAKA
jgi:uncharacterized repeat protein (TIGR01451 family)